MILAVTTRASLGHTGRPLAVHPAIAVAYALLSIGTIARVFGGGVLDYRLSVFVAGMFWSAAFLIYLIIYTPILVLPRTDGKSG